jgi:hypothetical protein
MTNPVYQAYRARAAYKLAAPTEAKPLPPQWKYREGDMLTLDARGVQEEQYADHAGLTCQVLSQFDGYNDADGNFHDTAGGCYYVGFACGCRMNVFEHWLKRDDGTRTEVQ